MHPKGRCQCRFTRLAKVLPEDDVETDTGGFGVGYPPRSCGRASRRGLVSSLVLRPERTPRVIGPHDQSLPKTIEDGRRERPGRVYQSPRKDERMS